MLFGAWFAVWIFTTAVTFKEEKEYLGSAWQADGEELQGAWTAYDEGSQDYYSVLKACDRLLPPSAELTLIIPAEPSVRFRYLQQKGRYILYPHNYGENDSLKEYVLVYGADDFSIPSNFEVIKNFADHKYLLKRKG